MVPRDTALVYDLCCDHGKIGMKVHQHMPATPVIFVDIIESIIEKLKVKLATYITSENNKLTILRKDATTLKIPSDKKALAIISGIGADLSIKIFNNLYRQNSNAYFLFCIHQKTELLKNKLIELNFNLIDAKFIIDNGKGYEIFLVQKNSSVAKELKMFQPDIYDYTSLEQKRLLEKQLNYFKKKKNFTNDQRFNQYIKELDSILSSFLVF